MGQGVFKKHYFNFPFALNKYLVCMCFTMRMKKVWHERLCNEIQGDLSSILSLWLSLSVTEVEWTMNSYKFNISSYSIKTLSYCKYCEYFSPLLSRYFIIFKQLIKLENFHFANYTNIVARFTRSFMTTIRKRQNKNEMCMG